MRYRRKPCIAGLLFLLIAFVIPVNAFCQTKPGHNPDIFEREYKTTVGAKYMLYLPEDYGKEDKKWPLLLFLHGFGGRGDDLRSVIRHGPPRYVEEGEKYPFVLVSPLCPENETWSINTLSALLDEITENYSVDQDRIYLTGLTMGADASWELAVREPERIAAIVPILGKGNPGKAPLIKHISAWIVHGAGNTYAPLNDSLAMVEALEEIGGHPRLTVYPGDALNFWENAYTDSELYNWLLKQKRGRQSEQPNIPVEITAEGLYSPQDYLFGDKLTVSMSTSAEEGVIRYTTGEIDPGWDSNLYKGPFEITSTKSVNAGLFNEDGSQIGRIRKVTFIKTLPRLKYSLFKTPEGGWNGMPDLRNIGPSSTGVLDNINGLNKLDWGYGFMLEGNISVDTDGDYTFHLTSYAPATLHIDNKLVAIRQKKFDKEKLSGVIHLKEGTHSFRVQVYSHHCGDISIRYDGPRIVNKLLTPIPLEGFKYSINVAERKPVTVSGGTQDEHIPECAVDGNMGTGWWGDPSPQWLEIDLETTYNINQIGIYLYWDGSRYYQYTVEVSKNRSDWTQVVDMSKNTNPSSASGDLHEIETVEARYVRVNMLHNSANPGVHLNEIIIFTAN